MINTGHFLCLDLKGVIGALIVKKKEGKNVGSYLKTSEKIWLFFSNLSKVSNLGELTL